MKLIKYPEKQEIPDLLKRPVFDIEVMFERVDPLIRRVIEDGDDALRGFTQRFDGVSLKRIAVTRDEITDAGSMVSPKLKAAIEHAGANIRRFHESQRESGLRVEIAPGVTCWRKGVPIDRVGLYIPGGSSPLFSTLLMLAIPAQVAGCSDIVVCSPPQKNGRIAPEVLYICEKLGITKVYKVGGAQAIAAMAYGTETIPKVDKIFGPGNQYVTAAKQMVSARGIAIDLPAGPSEVMVVADETARPDFVAADLLSQAEHGPDSQAILITTSEGLIAQVQAEIMRLKTILSRRHIIEQALKNSIVVLVANLGQAMDMVNIYAPEHLILAVSDPEQAAEKVRNAGSVFLGNYSPESAGDYASGTNHTLPTNHYAAAYSGVSLDSFIKKITFQRLTKNGLDSLAPTIETMARAEGLDAHAMAVSLRVKKDLP